MNNIIKRTWNQNRVVQIEDLTGSAFQSESGGHTFEISGVDDTGAAVSLSGTVEGRFLRADNAEIIISGTASSGKASVTLSEACYAIPGRFLLTVYVTSGGQKVAVYAATGSVVATSGTASGSIPPLVTDSVQANTGTFGSINTGNATVDGVLDVTQRRCEATLSSSGWYRVCKITKIGIGDYSFALDLNICRQFYSENNEQHGIRLIANSDSYSFVNENSKSNTQIITKIRYIRDSNTNGYVDIYYDLSNANIVYCEFAAHGFYPNLYTIESLQPVGPSPSGETVQTEYTFAENTITDISSIFTLNTSGISGLTGKIHAIYDASSGLVHLNFSAYAASTFDTRTPIFTCANSRYVPKATTYGNGMIRLDTADWYPYEVSIGITGNIFQCLTSDATRVYGQITYQV